MVKRKNNSLFSYLYFFLTFLFPFFRLVHLNLQFLNQIKKKINIKEKYWKITIRFILLEDILQFRDVIHFLEKGEIKNKSFWSLRKHIKFIKNLFGKNKKLKNCKKKLRLCHSIKSVRLFDLTESKVEIFKVYDIRGRI